MKFTNWKSPSLRQLLKEYKVEHDMKGNKFWGSKREFIDAVKHAKVERITKEADQAIDYRSGTKDKGQLLNLIKGYRSYPKYRNEGTLNAIYNGYAKNAPMDRPIVVDFGKGGRRVFSGNTRMDAAFHSGVDPEVLVVSGRKFAAQLTGGGQGMKLKEFRYYPYPGSPYGPQPMRGYENPYGKDFYEDRDKERKHGLIKAGLIGAGLLGGGALAGRGLFKAGLSAAARRSDDLVKVNASLGDEVARLRKATSEAPAPKPPRVAPKQPAPEAPVVVPEMVAPPPPVVPKPAPVPPKAKIKAQPAPPPAPEGRLAAQSDAAAEIAERRNAAELAKSSAQAELTEAEKLSQTSEKLREWNQKKLADQAKKKPRGRKKAAAVSELPPKAKAAVRRTARKRADSNFNRELMERKKAEAAAVQQQVDQMNQRLAGASNTKPQPAALAEAFAEEMGEPKKRATGGSKKRATGGSKKKVTEASVPHEIYKGHKVFTDPAFIEKWGSVAAQKKIIDRATGLTARLRGLKEFNFVADEAGVPFTGKVAKDRFIKKLRDEDLDRRDANILRAGATGAVAGLLFRGRLSRGKRALIGAGIGGAGVIGTRMATERTRDIYGERSRGGQRAEALPALAGLGAAGWLATRRIRGLAAKIRGVRLFNHRGHRGHGGLKEFEDYKLYYFKGRNTGIAARSAEEARKKKKRGGDELVAVRTPNATEKSQMARGSWVRTRRDGKSPRQSRYGKGRGQGPARKRMGAKIRVKFFEKKKEKKSGSMNPYVGAALSGGASGALLGGLSILRRGVKPMSALGTAAKLGGVSAGIVGGGALLGSRIIGKPREEEGAPFTKRAGIGGAIAGAGVGAAGALALRKTRGGARLLVSASKNWHPAVWVRKSPLAAGIAVGGVVGGAYGLAQGLDEGQQVDSILNLRKDIKAMSRCLPRLREFGVFQKTRKWYRGENMNGMQRMALAQARKVNPKAAASLKAGFIKDNHSANKLVLGAGVLPPVLTTGLGVAATYHSAGLGKKKEQEMSAKFFGRRDQPRWYSPGTNEHGQFGDVKVGWVEDRPMFTEIRKTQRDGKVVKEVIPWEPSSPQLVNSLLRDAKNQRVNVQRGGRLTRDVFDEIRGAERRRDASGRIKKREWEKSWFQNRAQEIGIAAAGGAGLLTARYAHNNPHTKVGQAYTNAKLGLRETKRNAADIGGKILKTATEITRRRFSAKLAKLRELDAMAEYAGWDVRDPRGRSARVFAPGSRRRERRPKEWHEKTENERKLWKTGIAAGVLGGAGLALIGQRLVSGKSLIPSRFVPKQPNPEVFVDAAKMFRPGAA